MDVNQNYQCVLRELPAIHATLRGWTQRKGGDNEWGPEDDLFWEDTWDGTMDTFLEAAATNYPRPPGDTRHGLAAFLAFHSWKQQHTVTLHPLDNNPKRRTPEDSSTTAVTIQQDPEKATGYHLSWSDRAPDPPASSTLQDIFTTISAALQEAKAPQKPDDEMPQAPPPPTAQERPTKSPSPTPSQKCNPPRNTAPPRTGTGFEICRGNGQSTTAPACGMKSHRGSRQSASTRSRNQPTFGHYLQTATTSSSPSKGMPPSHQQRETP